ncbi:MAG: DUF5989 family protein [Acidimicrobiales bacterium]
MRLRLKYGYRLARDVVRFTAVNRAWWFVPFMVLLALIGLAMTAAKTAVPAAVYTLF